MDLSQIRKSKQRLRRALRVRKTLRGTTAKPRLSVVKTNKHLHVQLIDDSKGVTIAGVSTASKKSEHNKKSVEAGKVLGATLAKMALEKNVKSVVFDRGSHSYHGVLAAVADSAREVGLQF